MNAQGSPAELVAAVAEAMNMLGVVAASPAFARMRQELAPQDVRRALLDSLESLLQFISRLRNGSSGGEQFIQAEPAIQEMERRVKQWQPDEQQVRELTEQARMCLSAMGIKTPPGGWDALAEM
jgi:hypothetical protein